MKEPRIHSHITDCLEETNPLAKQETIYCKRCRSMVSCMNECMRTWVETGKGNYCLNCFVVVADDPTEGYLSPAFGLLGKTGD